MPVAPKPKPEPEPPVASGKPVATGPLDPDATAPATVNAGPIEPGVTPAATADAGPIDPKTAGAGATKAPTTVQKSSAAEPTQPPKTEEPVPEGTAGAACGVQRRSEFGTYVKRCPTEGSTAPPEDGDVADDDAGDGTPADANAPGDDSRDGYQLVQENSVDNARAALTNRIKTKEPDHQSPFNFKQAYNDITEGNPNLDTKSSVSEVFPQFENQFADEDIEITDEPYLETDLYNHELTINGKTVPPAKDSIMQQYVSPKGDVLVAAWSERANDNAWGPKGANGQQPRLDPDPGALTWSDLSFQTMSDKVGAGNVKNLKWVIRSNIKNKGTIATLDLAYNNMDIHTEKAIFRATGGPPVETEAFNAISRTVNVKGVNWMLADHHQAFGDKTIQKIISFYTPNGPMPDIYLLLG